MNNDIETLSESPPLTDTNETLMLKSVFFFAAAREKTGTKEISSFKLPSHSTVEDFLDIISQQYPLLTEILDTVGIAVNEEYVELEHKLVDGDQIAIIPPISGG